MSKTAAELADIIAEKKLKNEQRAYESLRAKVIDSTTKMIAETAMNNELELSDQDLVALGRVTEELRELGYKFRFIEIQDSSGNVLKHKLHISIAHLA